MKLAVEEIMSLVRTELGRRSEGGAGFSEAIAPSGGGLPRIRQVGWNEVQPVQGRPNAKPKLDDFLVLRDEAFVKASYWHILGREADPVGLDGYLSALRGAKSTKLDVLQSLSTSAEARARTYTISGLKRALLINRFRHLLKDRIPLFRSVVRWLLPFLRLDKLVRRVDSLEGMIEARLAEQRQTLESLLARQVEVINEALIHRDHEIEGLKKKLVAATDRNAELQQRVDEGHERYLELNHVVVVEMDNALKKLREDVLLAGEVARTRFQQTRNEFRELRQKLVEGAEEELRRIAVGVDSRLQRQIDEHLSLNHVVRVEHANALGSVTEAMAAQRSQFDELNRRVSDFRSNLLDQDRRVGHLLREARKRLPEPFDQNQLESLVSEEAHRLDALYVTFEDRFRGTRNEIKERVSVFVDRVVAAGLGQSHSPVFDIGCGRGEWLEVLRDAGLTARGIDLNRVMVAHCQEMGLDVRELDALTALRELPTGSIGVLSGFHIIEHLPLDVLISLFDEAYRVLVPGGFILFETPNPENLLTSAYSFYFDPTHRHPLPPPLVEFLVEARGFCDIEIVRLHQNLEVSKELFPISPTLNHFFASPQDYAVLGHKPALTSRTAPK